MSKMCMNIPLHNFRKDGEYRDWLLNVTHPLTHSCTHSLTHSFIHVHAHSPTHSLTHSLTHSHSFTYSHTHSHTHLLIHSIMHVYSMEPRPTIFNILTQIMTKWENNYLPGILQTCRDVHIKWEAVKLRNCVYYMTDLLAYNFLSYPLYLLRKQGCKLYHIYYISPNHRFFTYCGIAVALKYV